MNIVSHANTERVYHYDNVAENWLLRWNSSDVTGEYMRRICTRQESTSRAYNVSSTYEKFYKLQRVVNVLKK